MVDDHEEGKMVKQDIKLYYTAPDDKIFNDLKDRAIELWGTYDDTYGYAGEKIARVNAVGNIQDNFMYIFAMFDWLNQAKILSRVSEETKKAIEVRLPKIDQREGAK